MPNTDIIDALDELSRARNLVGVLAIASSRTDGPEDDNHSYGELARSISEHLDASREMLEDLVRGEKNAAVA